MTRRPDRELQCLVRRALVRLDAGARCFKRLTEEGTTMDHKIDLLRQAFRDAALAVIADPSNAQLVTALRRSARELREGLEDVGRAYARGEG